MNLKAILEGYLFVVGNEGITYTQIMTALEIDETKLNSLINELEKDYEREDRGIAINKFGDSLKLTTKKEHKEYYEKLLEVEQNEVLSQAVLETLAIIAYNNPSTKSQIEAIRGVDSTYAIKKLMFRNLIEEKGRAETLGKPRLYGVTNQFLDYMGLTSLDQLPKIDFQLPEDKDEDSNLFESKYHE